MARSSTYRNTAIWEETIDGTINTLCQDSFLDLFKTSAGIKTEKLFCKKCLI